MYGKLLNLKLKFESVNVGDNPRECGVNAMLGKNRMAFMIKSFSDFFIFIIIFPKIK